MTSSGQIKIDAMFFTATGEKADDSNDKLDYKTKPSFILCNPNAMFYQHMINYPHAYYLRYFLAKGINVMIWNYRGYGRSSAKKRCLCLGPSNSTTPQNIQQDAEEVLAYMRKDMGLKGKLGVYGRSLGGIATAHLADDVDMIIADRTFANLDDVVERKFFGTPALCLYKSLTQTRYWRSSNDYNFVNKGIAEKIPSESVVHSSASQ